MNILVVGSGGREHALAWKIAQSPKTDKLFIAPGNAGTKTVGTNVDIAVDDFEKLKKFSVENDIDLILVGPEDPLCKGIRDFFENSRDASHIAVIGPDSKGARLEGSKDFSKAFMKKYGIPTAAYRTFTIENIEEGYDFLDTLEPPYVLKADGLAAGKGVLIVNDPGIAKLDLESMLAHEKFGNASKKVVIEEYLKGIELSVFVMTDGKSYVILPEAKDYKRIGEGDTGLNTGGMGAISPVHFAKGDFLDKVEKKVVIPTIEGLRKEGIDYKGFLFIGLMNVDGEPYVIEYNVRMGDPETQVVIPRIKSDFVELLEGIANNDLGSRNYEADPRFATTVVMASGGYPESYDTNKPILGLDKEMDALVFHAGTKESGGHIYTSGGRVLAVTGFGNDMDEALACAYKTIDEITFARCYYRKDIGFDLK